MMPTGKYAPELRLGGIVDKEDTGTDYHGMAKLEGPRAKVLMKFASGTELKLHLDGDRGPGLGAIFVCEKGKLEINRNKLASNPKDIIRCAGQSRSQPAGRDGLSYRELGRVHQEPETLQRGHRDRSAGHHALLSGQHRARHRTGGRTVEVGRGGRAVHQLRRSEQTAVAPPAEGLRIARHRVAIRQSCSDTLGWPYNRHPNGYFDVTLRRHPEHCCRLCGGRAGRVATDRGYARCSRRRDCRGLRAGGDTERISGRQPQGIRRLLVGLRGRQGIRLRLHVPIAGRPSDDRRAAASGSGRRREGQLGLRAEVSAARRRVAHGDSARYGRQVHQWAADPARVDANGGLYRHWVPGDPLRALAGPTYIQNADAIY